MLDIQRDYKIEDFKKKIGLTEDIKINKGDGGVYIIYSPSTDWCYVGKANDFNTRYRQHFNALKNNNHNRTKLQDIYNKFGKEDLVFMPVYKCPEFMSLEVESAYIHNLGLNCVNFGSARTGFTFRDMDEERIVTDGIPIKYKIIIENHRKWKYKFSHNGYSEYLNIMVEKGIDILKVGFKWIDEIESGDNMKIIEKYKNNHKDFAQMQLDYIAVGILDDILGQEKSSHIFCRNRLNQYEDFESDDLIYNIYKKLRKDDVFRNDIILAPTSFIGDRKPIYGCKLGITEIIKKKLKIENVFDLLYVYIISMFIMELMEESEKYK